MAATGVPNTALIPAAAPATSRLSSLSGSQVEELADDRADGAAGQDDRALGTERAAGPDADGARDRLQDGEARLDLAAVDEDPLHRLGDAVASDLLGAEPRHQPDDEAAADRDDDGDGAQGVGVGRDQVDAEPLVVEEVGEEPDHVEQRQRDAGSEGADRQQGQRARGAGSPAWW